MHPIDILLVEDNEGDILLTSVALEEGGIANNLTIIRDGWEAIEYLKQKDKYQNCTLPDLILLDINLPKLNGFEVLNLIKKSEDLKHLHVILLSTSEAKVNEVSRLEELADFYITKPLNSYGFIDVISSIKNSLDRKASLK